MLFFRTFDNLMMRNKIRYVKMGTNCLFLSHKAVTQKSFRLSIHWRAKFLTLVGRTILIKSARNTIHAHAMQINLLSPKIITKIDRLQWNFL